MNNIKTNSHRLQTTLFLATAFHLILILGIVFNLLPSPKPKQARPLEITLVHKKSQRAPDKADFLAQSHQLGSGDQLLKTPTALPLQSPFQSSLPKPVTDLSPEQQAQFQSTTPSHSVITTTHANQTTAFKITEEQPLTEKDKDLAAEAFLSTHEQLESLKTLLDKLAEAQSHRPKIRQISAASFEATDAEYLTLWRQRIEKVGNLNYPDEARRRNLEGALRMLVAIRKDGTLLRTEIRESSGEPLLDDAAIRIVKLAAPFAPFPSSIQKTTDVLEIIRTWQFTKENQLFTGG